MFALLAATTGWVSGHYDLADALFIIGAILAGVGAVLAVQAKALWATLVAAALCLGLIGWFVT